MASTPNRTPEFSSQNSVSGVGGLVSTATTKLAYPGPK
ncbi:hypothetical protein I552_5870 [Mycobacterium xenopi 3993]|nr:hypothetical protein I552_5870 [Mycobacterium xenopi 3993]